MQDFFAIYDKHYKRGGNVVLNYKTVSADPAKYTLHDEWLPDNFNAKILDIGCGWGILILYLWVTGYRRLTGVEISKNMFEVAKKSLPEEINLICGDAIDFLKSTKEKYNLITIFDVVEHMDVDKAIELLKVCREVLTEKGSIVIRTPNMSNILSSYSRYMDITHLVGYTEWSLFQLLDNAGFQFYRVIKPKLFSHGEWKHQRTLTCPWRGLGLRELLNTLVHNSLFKLRGQNPLPSTYHFNITVQSWKEEPK